MRELETSKQENIGRELFFFKSRHKKNSECLCDIVIKRSVSENAMALVEIYF